MLQAIRGRDVQPILENVGYQRPPKAKTPEDVAAIAITIIDNAVKQGTEIFQIGMAIGVRSNSSKIQNSSDEVLRRYIRPMLQYIELRLFENAADTSPA